MRWSGQVAIYSLLRIIMKVQLGRQRQRSIHQLVVKPSAIIAKTPRSLFKMEISRSEDNSPVISHVRGFLRTDYIAAIVAASPATLH